MFGDQWLDGLLLRWFPAKLDLGSHLLSMGLKPSCQIRLVHVAVQEFVLVSKTTSRTVAECMWQCSWYLAVWNSTLTTCGSLCNWNCLPNARDWLQVWWAELLPSRCAWRNLEGLRSVDVHLGSAETGRHMSFAPLLVRTFAVAVL